VKDGIIRHKHYISGNTSSELINEIHNIKQHKTTQNNTKQHKTTSHEIIHPSILNWWHKTIATDRAGTSV